jgi:glucosamine kinase
VNILAGIDAGQSSTHAVLIDELGRVLGRGDAGPADHIDEPADSQRLADACEGAVARALAAAHLDPRAPLDAVVVGLSGYEGAIRGARPRLPTKNLRFVHDSVIAHSGAFAGGPGVIVISGTGSVGYGRDAGNETVRVGGWGYLFGDAGSSFAIARHALQRAMIDTDRGITSQLGEAALAFFNKASLRELADAFYLREIDRSTLASFARVVADGARLGELESIEVTESAAAALAACAAGIGERLDFGPEFPVAWVGGSFASAPLRAAADRALAAVSTRARATDPRYQPVIGAALLAFADARLPVPTDVREA